MKYIEQESSDEKQPLFEEVGLIGTTEMKITDGNCVFSGLKFLTTCYKAAVKCFHLVVTVQQEADGS